MSESLLVALHDEHARDLWSYVLRLTNGDRSRAEDVVQETFLRAWRHPDVLGRSAGSARAWLFTVARRIVVDEWRSGRRRHEVLAAEPPEPPEAHGRAHTTSAEDALDGWVVAEALTRLSAQHRQVLVLCWFGGRSVAEAARELGVPPGTVKSRTHYALRSLRLVLEEMGVER
ncbi:sigma-70 family RNA polymerase sigma factor [Cellulomonas carbonis]|uniref:RNA polymerase sigma factor n=1 Tax=Cellulomonas carbonis T26 TaxID=947969 RepID=A0A0A0BKH4_9CELL|nr:sigma-70 family RNA polymerase sigma factor [Cellulomonas carbonis]KGM08491.1 RNA polymerase sigma factor [Cellulomonas carbonis T26]GGB99243.1 RNA polymerase sigma factor [Cellulomonas carbonis]